MATSRLVLSTNRPYLGSRFSHIISLVTSRSDLTDCLKSQTAVEGNDGNCASNLAECETDNIATHADLNTCLVQKQQCEDRADSSLSTLQDALKQCQDNLATMTTDDLTCHAQLLDCTATEAACEAEHQIITKEAAQCKSDLTNRCVSTTRVFYIYMIECDLDFAILVFLTLVSSYTLLFI
jgi:hypothetical protein